MKKEIKIIGLLLLLAFLLVACSGDDELDKDTIPPTKPNLIPHLGDTGDGEIAYNGHNIFLNDANNGIDAESGERGFRLMWDPLIYDNDLEKIFINRYMNDDIENIAKIDSITADNEYYIDNSISADYLHENKFSYFIDLIDRAGNSTRSDTVHYRLAEKTYLLAPQNGTSLSTSHNMIFDWNYTGNYDFYRVLLFNDSDVLLWFKDVLIDAPDENLQDDSSALYTGVLADGRYYWRVDVFKYDYELDPYYDNGRTFYYGSESDISEFLIDRNKN